MPASSPPLNSVRIPAVKPELYLPKGIAIVGSAQKALEKKYGTEIDSHECVIRFNRSPTKNFESHVGSKTTLRVCNDQVFRSKPHTRFAVDVNFMKGVHHSKILVQARGWRLWRIRLFAPLWVSSSNSIYTVSTAEAETIVSELTGLSNLTPTVGFTMMCLIVKTGIIPQLYGWSLDESMGHYFEKHDGKFSSFHDNKKERMIWKTWQEQGKINVVE